MFGIPVVNFNGYFECSYLKKLLYDTKNKIIICKDQDIELKRLNDTLEILKKKISNTNCDIV